MSNPYWCLVIDHKKKPVGKLFRVWLTPNDLIEDLKVKVKSFKGNALDKVDADQLSVWRCRMLRLREPLQDEALERSEIERRIKAINFSDKVNSFIITPHKTVTNLGLTEDDTLLVQMPGTFTMLEFVLIINESFQPIFLV
jgi:hypothetical protein